MRTKLRAVVVGGVVALALTGCVPSEPSSANWRSTAAQSLEDTVSEVESVALVLELQSHDRLPGGAARVAAVESEEALASAEEGVTTLQPPAGAERADTEVVDLLARASDLVREARMAITAADEAAAEAAYADLRRRLLDLSEELDAARAALR